MAKISCGTGDTLSLFNPMGIVSGIGNVLSSVFGQALSTLKNGIGFVVGLIVPKSPVPGTPVNPTENNPPLADASDEIALVDEADADAYPVPLITSTVPAALATTTIPRVPPKTAPAPSTATTPKVLGVATTTAMSSPITSSDGGNTPARNLAVDDVVEETPDEAQNSTSTASSTPPLSSDANHVLISEILFDAEGADAGKEFIELYNPTEGAIALVGYSLKYIAGTSTTAHSLAALRAATTTEQSVIPARGFLLLGFGGYQSENYEGINADVLRSASLPNGEDIHGNPVKIKVGFINETGLEIDSLVYDKNSITAPGKSLERLAWSDACVPAKSENEFLGNGCASGGTQFEIRQIPRPQNSASMPEPREKPTTPSGPGGAVQAIYSSSTLTIDINWIPSRDSQNSTSGITYMLYDLSSSAPVLISTTTNATSSFGAQPGKTYDLGLIAEDRDGLSSATTTFSVFVSDFLDKVYFYLDPKAPSSTPSYLLDLRYSRRPIVPVSDGIVGYQALVFYLNREPNPQNSSMGYLEGYALKDMSGVVALSGASPGVLAFSYNPAYSSGFGGGLNNSTFVLPEEDGRLTVNPGIQSATSNDYITFAYYNHANYGSTIYGAQFVLVATDARKIYLGEAPVEIAPSTPSNLDLNFDSTSLQLKMSWASSTDPDSADLNITYEINVSTSTELASSAWQSVGKNLGAVISLAFGNQYLVGLRAKDDYGNYSEIASSSWSFPADFQPIAPILTVESTDGSFTFTPGANSTIQKIIITDANGIYGACGNNQSKVSINGHNYPLSSTAGTTPEQYIYEIVPDAENIYVGAPIAISWQGSYWWGNGITGLWPIWVNFGNQGFVQFQNYQSCQLPIATSTATLVGA
jgi:hypothetical protein